ncbi:MAG: hypothetical protein NTV52_31560 [Acidobacteria bacterium]|nr:hypothetical protein [Acidobacteriota bacterium]
MQNQNLYESLTRFLLAPPFAKRLSRENGWSIHYTAKAIAEYKRFVYLAAVSPTPVTPSEVVDKVWHLHLLYTRSYWQGLCAEVLGRPLHHDPSAGGRNETAKFLSGYEATKALYRQEFGEEPAADLWPVTADWILPRSPWWARFRSFAVFPTVLPLLGFSIGVGPALLLAALFAFIVAIPLLAQLGEGKRRRHAEGADVSGIDFSGDSSDCGDGGGDCGDGGGGCGGGGCGGGD